jgi:hypothetical protein
MVCLSSLNEKIARFIFMMKHVPCPSHDEVPTSTISDGTNSVTLNPVGEIFHLLSTFLSVLRALNTSRRRPFPTSESPEDTKNQNSPYENPPPAQSLPCNTPTILTTITTYIQLIRLINAICTRLLIALDRMTANEVDKSLPLPGLQLGGFPLSQGHLHLKIIIQALEHQLHAIERVMGFPQDFRLSKVREEEDDDGVFCNEEILGLLRVVMMQGVGDDNTGFESVAVLKENFCKVNLALRA